MTMGRSGIGSTSQPSCSLSRVDAYGRGRIDAVTGKKVGDNPYPETENDHWLWMQGWADAKEANAGVEPRRDRDVGSDPLLDMIAGVGDGWHWDDVLRLSSMELRRAGIGGDLPRKLNVMADPAMSLVTSCRTSATTVRRTAARDASVQRIPHPPQIPPRRIPMRIPPPAAQRNRVSNPPPEVPAQRNRAHLPAGLRVEPVGNRPGACGPVLAACLDSLKPVSLRDGNRPHLQDADGTSVVTDG